MTKKIAIVFLSFLCSIIFIANDSFAGWTQAKGHAYNQLTYGYYVSSHKYTTVEKAAATGNNTGLGGGNERVEASKFTAHSITYYGEYGITDTLTVFTAVPWKSVESDDTIMFSDRRGPSGIGDIDLGLRYNLTQSFAGGPLSLQGTVKTPDAYEYGNPLSTLSLGDGQYDATLALVYGKGLGKGYAVLNAGYKYRFENHEYYHFKPSDQIKVSLSGGYQIASKVGLGAIIDWTRAVGNATVSEEMEKANYPYGGKAFEKDNILIRDSLGLEQNVFNVGASAVYSISSNVQAVLSYAVDLKGAWIFETRDAGVGETYNVGLVYTF
ncbi:MAG: hypothetical protein HY806_01975 [Nitrospirae bacterium]|nr:hypothetical protein [Nitrospirota bacterium]